MQYHLCDDVKVSFFSFVLLRFLSILEGILRFQTFKRFTFLALEALLRLEALPLNANGKVDRRRLPDPLRSEAQAKIKMFVKYFKSKIRTFFCKSFLFQRYIWIRKIWMQIPKF